MYLTYNYFNKYSLKGTILNISIHGRHLEITDAIKNYAEKKATKIEKFFERIGNVQIILDIDGDNHVVEMIVPVSKGPTLIGVVSHSNMYASIDLVVDKLEKQLTKYKEKLHSRKKRKDKQPLLEINENGTNDENVIVEEEV